MASQHMHQQHVAVMLLLTTMLLLLVALLPTPAIAAFNATHLQPVEGSKTFSTVLYGTTPVVAEDHRIATISITLPDNTDVILLDSAMFDLFTTQTQRAIISEQKISAQVVGGIKTIVLSLPADGTASIVPAGEAVQCHIAVTFGSKHDIRSVHAADIPILLEVHYAHTTTTPTAFHIAMPTFSTAAPTDMFETADQRTLHHSALITRGNHPDHTDAMSHVILYPALAKPSYGTTDINDQKLSEIKIFLSGPWDYIPPSHPNTTHTCRVNSVDCPVTYSGGGNALSMLSINLTKRSVYVQHNLPLGIACDDTIFRPKRSTTTHTMTLPQPTTTPTNLTTDNIRSSYRGALIIELYDAKGVLADTLPMNSFHNVVDLDTTQLPLLTAPKTYTSLSIEPRRVGKYHMISTFHLEYPQKMGTPDFVQNDAEFVFMTHNMYQAKATAENHNRVTITIPTSARQTKEDDHHRTTNDDININNNKNNNPITYTTTTASSFLSPHRRVIDLRAAFSGRNGSTYTTPKGNAMLILEVRGDYSPQTPKVMQWYSHVDPPSSGHVSLIYRTRCVDLHTMEDGGMCQYPLFLKNDRAYTHSAQAVIYPLSLRPVTLHADVGAPIRLDFDPLSAEFYKDATLAGRLTHSFELTLRNPDAYLLNGPFNDTDCKAQVVGDTSTTLYSSTTFGSRPVEDDENKGAVLGYGALHFKFLSAPTSPFYQGATLSIMCNTTLVRRREVGGDQRSVDWVLSVTSSGTTPDADPLFHTRKASGMNWLQKNGGGNADPDHFIPTKGGGGGDVLSILIILAVFVACCVILWQKCFRAIFVQNKSGAGNTLGDELIDSTQSHDDIQL